MAVHLFGIRHHGPGSARSLLAALERIRPRVVLIEGPPEAEPLLPLLSHPEMKPPVAILLYAAGNPQEACFYPFAVFSPEWQAIQYAARNAVQVRFIDLPQSVSLALSEAEKNKARNAEEERENEEGANREKEAARAELQPSDQPNAPPQNGSAGGNLREDPLNWLARAAGFEDGETWWEHLVEHRRDPGDVFLAIQEAMTALRAELPNEGSPDELLREERREACMRQAIRAARKEYDEIAVVCGAWHVPALLDLAGASADSALLKGLPKTKVAVTCIPWTHGRLASESGYRAGVNSPGWYHHLWTATGHPIARWMSKVAQLLRAEDLDASSAQVIEAVRMAETLASLAERPFPSLADLNDAALSVLCHGDGLPMRLIHRKLVVGEELGAVPSETPRTPLQQDLGAEQKRLRLKPDATPRALDLDLRGANDLDRSHLLHRLDLLGIPWGRLGYVSGAKGTFRESWTIAWDPEFEIVLIERGAWGHTLPAAAGAYARHLADGAKELSGLTTLLEKSLLASLPEAAAYATRRLQEEAAIGNDVVQLMAALPALARVLRYGSVRQTDTQVLAGIVHGLVARICIGLPVACASLNEEAARSIFERVDEVQGALATLEDAAVMETWREALCKLAGQDGLHGLVAGRCVRLLSDASALPADEAAALFGRALSAAVEPSAAAAWAEGFLAGSGLLLVHDPALLRMVDEWLSGLAPAHFLNQLPALRRIFATFQGPERRAIGERIAGGPAGLGRATEPGFDAARAALALPLLAQLLGMRYGKAAEEVAP